MVAGVGEENQSATPMATGLRLRHGVLPQKGHDEVAPLRHARMRQPSANEPARKPPNSCAAQDVIWLVDGYVLKRQPVWLVGGSVCQATGLPCDGYGNIQGVARTRKSVHAT
jgi:hypothetical protein